MVGLLVFTAASLLCGLPWSAGALIGARVLQGIGAAIMTPAALSIISTTFEEGAERNKALGIWGMMGAFGATAAWLGGALGVAIVSTVAVSRSEDYLAANDGANALVVLTEGFQSALLACVVLAGIGAALALLLLGRPRQAVRERLGPSEQPEPMREAA
jgi:MFS family permease